jgi:sugar phosphate isomerase/epimerase
MRLSVFSASLQELTWQPMLTWLAKQGVQWLELGCGAYPGSQHADAHRLRSDVVYRAEKLSELAHHGLTLAALACHGNPLHPDAATAKQHDADLQAAIDAAHAMGVPVVVCFSGQPADISRSGPVTGAITPNWPVVGWPFEYAELRERQWDQSLIPYWKKTAARAQALGVQLALEMHGGFAVHNPASLLRLRDACGPAIGTNLDPSHCWWQSIDPVVAVQALGSAVAHVHLKDTVFNAEALALNGILDATAFSQPGNRAWHFGIPGQGHGPAVWQALLQALATTGYAGVLSVEHEAPMPALQGIESTLAFMRGLRNEVPP